MPRNSYSPDECDTFMPQCDSKVSQSDRKLSQRDKFSRYSSTRNLDQPGRIDVLLVQSSEYQSSNGRRKAAAIVHQLLGHGKIRNLVFKLHVLREENHGIGRTKRR